MCEVSTLLDDITTNYQSFFTLLSINLLLLQSKEVVHNYNKLLIGREFNFDL